MLSLRELAERGSSNHFHRLFIQRAYLHLANCIFVEISSRLIDDKNQARLLCHLIDHVIYAM